MIEIRPTTLQDSVEFYGGAPPTTIRAVSVVKDGILRCIAGVTKQGIAFSDMKDNGTPAKTRFKIAREIAKWMEKYHPVVILAPHEMKSDKFLRKLGFTHLAEKEKLHIYRL